MAKSVLITFNEANLPALLLSSRERHLHVVPKPWESAEWVVPTLARVNAGEGTRYPTELPLPEFVQRTGWKLLDTFGEYAALIENASGNQVAIWIDPSGGGVRRLEYTRSEPND